MVVPRSLVFNWNEEAARFAPKLRCSISAAAARSVERFAGYDVVLTTYGTLRRDAAMLKDVEFDYAILDEAQAIKNADTASAKAARLLRARHRLALSGTPIENHLGELWSLFEFLNPGLLGIGEAFSGASAATDARRATLEWLSRALRPFILRRTKEQVAPELPRAHRADVALRPRSGRSAQLYDELRDHYRATLLARIASDGMQIEDAHPRGAAAAAAGGLPSRPDRSEPRRTSRRRSSTR